MSPKPEVSSPRRLILTSMELSSFHGLPNIARTQKTSVKVMWILVMLVSSAICGFLVAKTIIQYLNYEVYSKFNLISDVPAEFPTISICNVNPFVTNESFKFLEDLLKQNHQDYMTDMPSPGQQSQTKHVFEIMEQFWDYMSKKYWLQLRAKNPEISEKQKKSFGHPFDQMFILCLFQAFECNIQLFKWYYDTLNGNCYRFNSGVSGVDGKKLKILTTTQPGNAEGLQLFIYVGVPDHPLTFSMKKGAHISIHNSSVEPTPLEGIELPVGMQTNIAVRREFVNKLPKPFNDCYDDLTKVNSYNSDLYRKIIRSNQTYRQADCLRACLQSWIVQNCGCYDLNMPVVANTKACYTFQDLKCVQARYFEFYYESLNDRCGDQCPQECDTWTYKFTTSYADFPTESMVKILARIPSFGKKFTNFTYEFIKENFLLLNVYYEDMRYTLIEEQEAMNWIDMISNIGGTMGLFLGISFLSFIELIEFGIEALALICCRRSQVEIIEATS